MQNFLLSITIVFMVGATNLMAAEAPDSSFRPIILGGTGFVEKIAIQPDGKVLMGGEFASVGGSLRRTIVRLDTDGSVDSSFTAGPVDELEAMELQPDGKILISVYSAPTITDGFVGSLSLKRLNADGSFDATFFTGSVDDSIDAIAVQNDGKILIAGYFTTYSGIERPGIARLFPNGTVDTTTFDPGFGASDVIQDIIPMSDGKIYVAGHFNVYNGVIRKKIARLNADGSLDPTFDTGSVFGNNDAGVVSMAVQSDGKVIGAGFFSVSGGSTRNGLARFNTNGTLDATFNPAFATGQTQTGVNHTVLQPDGKVIIAGGSTYSGRHALARLNTDGSLDTGFDANIPVGNFDAFIAALAVASDGKVLVGGRANSFGGVVREAIARLNANGSGDQSFNAGPIRLSGSVSSVAVEPDGQVLIGGFDLTSVNGIARTAMVRLNRGGSVDPTFDPLITNTNGSSGVFRITLQPDGKMIIQGSFTSIGGVAREGFARLNSNGTLDTTFNFTVASQFGTGFVNDTCLQPDGKILIAGFFVSINGVTRNGIGRLNSDGSTDTSFDPGAGIDNGSGGIGQMALQSDGRIIIGGYFTAFNGVPRTGLARLEQNGSLDTVFNPVINEAGTDALAVQSDDKVIIGGYFIIVNGVVRNGIARLNADGSLDTAFNSGSGPGATADLYIADIVVQPDGLIFIIGEFQTFNSVPRVNIARVLPNGSLDEDWVSLPPPNNTIYGATTSQNGTLYVNGEFEAFGDQIFTGVARFSDANAPFDYDADGRTDLSVFRPSEGAWYLQKSTEGFFGMLFGFSTDKITPADFDGDGKTDIAVFRPSDLRWYIANSSDGTYSTYVFGLADDTPAPADYDGDGRADLCMFRQSDGTWYIQYSSGGFFARQFGASTDKPTVGDFDGDGKSDLAVFRTTNGEWYQVYSSDGSIHGEQFGFTTDKLAYGDYDGDGKTDLAIFRPSERVFYLRNSATGTYEAFVFGLSDDIPTPGDYDGDGKADLSVFRPSDGNWYRQNSGNGTFNAFNFGLNGDKPTPTAYH